MQHRTRELPSTIAAAAVTAAFLAIVALPTVIAAGMLAPFAAALLP